MQYSIIIITLLIVIPFVIITHRRIRKGKIKLPDSYSYKRQIKISIIGLLITIAISLFAYFLSKSFEVAFSIGALLLCGVVSGCLFGLLVEYQTKRRGGRKVE
jgi:hypothetical protein